MWKIRACLSGFPSQQVLKSGEILACSLSTLNDQDEVKLDGVSGMECFGIVDGADHAKAVLGQQVKQDLADDRILRCHQNGFSFGGSWGLGF